MTVFRTAKYFKNYKFLSYKHLFPLVKEISLTMTHTQKFLRQRSTEISETTFHRNFWDNDPQKFLGQRSTEISGTTIHRNFRDNDLQKFLGQRSTEISGTMIHRNFWDNVPQKFLGQRSTEISGTTFHRNFWDKDPQKVLRQRSATEISGATIHRNSRTIRSFLDPKNFKPMILLQKFPRPSELKNAWIPLSLL